MFHLSDLRPLSDFKRSQVELLQHLKTTRWPLLLKLNGRAEVVIQDAASYQQLLEQADGQIDVRAEATQKRRAAAAPHRRNGGEPHAEVSR